MRRFVNECLNGFGWNLEWKYQIRDLLVYTKGDLEDTNLPFFFVNIGGVRTKWLSFDAFVYRLVW